MGKRVPYCLYMAAGHFCFKLVTKHPKFFGEMERRIVTSLQVGEQKRLEFRQKRTLLARHLPIDLVSDIDSEDYYRFLAFV